MKVYKIFFIILISNFVLGQENSSKDATLNYFEESTPEKEGLDSRYILNFIQKAENEIDELHSLMIIKNGKNIASGWWYPYSSKTPHIMHSLSKSFTSTAIGFAVDEGLLNLNDRVISFFPEYKNSINDVHFREIRIRDLLTMSTGEKFEINPSFSKEYNWSKLFFKTKLDFLPGTYFKYNSYATYMLSVILNKITGIPLVDYLNTKLFKPLNIDKPYWESCPLGINVGGWGLKIKTEDIAKFGQLYLQKGKWNNIQLISHDWIKMATSKQIDNSNTQSNSDWKQGYGFQFWKNRYNSYRGDGAFGQFCIVIPDYDMVIAITASTNDLQKVLNIFWEEIYLNLQSPEKFENNFENSNKLKDKLKKLKIKKHLKTQKKVRNNSKFEKTYFLNDNIFGIRSLKLKNINNELNLFLNTDSGNEKIIIGSEIYKKNQLSNFNFINHYNNKSLNYFKDKKLTNTEIAVNGNWVDKRTFSFKILFLDDTAKSVIKLYFDKKEVEMDINFEGVFGLQNLFKLSGSN